ncbi:hypothetical protein J6590_008731 [Homalodisca vitripennis]|nr:hypothetical protein J6590_008731 [Homalodisca vitripennis]
MYQYYPLDSQADWADPLVKHSSESANHSLTGTFSEQHYQCFCINLRYYSPHSQADWADPLVKHSSEQPATLFTHWYIL